MPHPTDGSPPQTPSTLPCRPRRLEAWVTIRPPAPRVGALSNCVNMTNETITTSTLENRRI